MGEQIIHVSDLTDKRIEKPDEQLVDILVTDHPNFEADEQRRLEALPAEVKDLGKLAVAAAVGLQVTMPGEEEPTRYVLTKDNFDKLSTGKPMDEVLVGAARVVAVVAKQRRNHNQTTSGEPLRNFDTLEYAGEPHKGKVGAGEAELVRNNLEAVNQRLQQQGKPIIDPANPEHAKRYGFTATA